MNSLPGSLNIYFCCCFIRCTGPAQPLPARQAQNKGRKKFFEKPGGERNEFLIFEVYSFPECGYYPDKILQRVANITSTLCYCIVIKTKFHVFYLFTIIFAGKKSLFPACIVYTPFESLLMFRVTALLPASMI